MATLPQTYGNLSYGSNGYSYSPQSLANDSAVTGAIASQDPIAVLHISGADIRFTLHIEENGQKVKAEFMPEPNISVLELLRINMLMMLFTNGGSPLRSEVMAYVRHHNLERHFRFTS